MNVLEKFENHTGYDLSSYFDTYYGFIQSDYKNIVDYYRGNSNVAKSSFAKLYLLVAESNKINSIISLNKESLSSEISFWVLLEDLENLRTKLFTVLELSKWMRSSYEFGFDSKPKIKSYLSQNQSIEELLIEFGFNDPNEDWVGVAVDNQIFELDYNYNSGIELSISKVKDDSFAFSTVVDIMVGKNILGKDIFKSVVFEEDDLLCLPIEDTFEQAAETCLNIVKGSIQEFPFLGISKNFVGTNIDTLRASSLIRQIGENFKTDDSLKSFELLKSFTEQDVAHYEFKIVSRINSETTKIL